MPWNYRVLRHKHLPVGTVSIDYTYEIHEVYFDEGQEAAPYRGSCTKDAVTVGGESLSELRGVLERMIEALDKPVLDYDEFGK